jgi:hypothetical protein
MSRYALLFVLCLGLVASAPLSAQQFRNKMPGVPVPPAPQNNAAPGQPAANGKIIGFNVIGGNSGNGGISNNIQGMLNASNPLGQNAAFPFNNTVPGFNPSSQFSAFNPLNYNAMMYGPYGLPPYGFNPYGYNPYLFSNTGQVVGGMNVPYPSMAQLYNFNLNYQYLANPYLNPLSNPAFSGPFPAGIFNSTAALTAMGFANLLQNGPLPANANTGGNNPFP